MLNRKVIIQIPDSLQKSLYDLASRDGISVDQFISTVIAEKIAFSLYSTAKIDNFK
jgi:predicted HicB family RNase H-like nuclease